MAGAAAGALAGAGAVWAGSAAIGSLGWLASTLMGILSSEVLLIAFLESWRAAGRRQKGDPPSSAQAKHDYDYALLSLAIYDGATDLKQESEDAKWTRMNIGQNHPGYSYRSRLFKNEDRRELVMVYEGSTPPFGGETWFGDWAANFQQGVGIFAEGWQYETAKQEAARAVAEARRLGYSITIAGHSLGGGLATAAALHTFQKAVTFNAAGVNSWTTNLLHASHLVTNYRVQGEVLSTLQDSSIFGWPMPNSSGGSTYWLKGRSASPIARHTDDILIGMRDFF
jgi:hypothetical protein